MKTQNLTISIFIIYILSACMPQETLTATGTISFAEFFTATPTSTNTPIPTSTITNTPKPSLRVFTNDELIEMAKTVKDELPSLVRNTESDVAPGFKPEVAPNFFTIEENNPNSAKLLKLTQMYMDIAFNGGIDLLEDIELQSYVLKMPDNTLRSEGLPLKGGYIVTKEILKKMENANISIGFPGTVMPNGEEKIDANKIYPEMDSSFMPSYQDGEYLPNEGFASFSEYHGITFGATWADWRQLTSYYSNKGLVTCKIDLKPNTKEFNIFTLPNGDLGYNSVAIIIGTITPQEGLSPLLANGLGEGSTFNVFAIQAALFSDEMK